MNIRVYGFIITILSLFMFSNCVRGAGSDVWFDSVQERPALNEDLKREIAQRVIGFGNGELIEGDGDSIVFLSIGNENSAATLRYASGENLEQALDNVIKSFSKSDLKKASYFKVDLVKSVAMEKDVNFEREVPYDLSLYGLAFEAPEKTALLPEQTMGGDLKELGRSDIVYFFETDSFYFENKEDFEIVDLYRGHRIYNKIDQSVLLNAVKEAGDYLKRSIDDDGYFVYEYSAALDEEEDDYNILRHAGTLFSMVQIYEKTGDEDLLEDIKNGLDYLVNALEPCFSGPQEALCLVENRNVKVGGQGLAILAIANYTRVTEDESYLEAAQKMARWLEFIQQDDGRFEPHKMNNKTGKVSDFVSGYYPGEAIFGLVSLYNVDGNKDWIDVAEANAKYLIQVRDEGKLISELDHDHWLLYGLNELHRIAPDDIYPEHARKIVEGILDSQRPEDFSVVDWVGSYYLPPRSTPTATRSEGLVAAYNLFKDYGEDDQFVERIFEGIENGVKFQLQTQFTYPEAMYLPNPRRAMGGFRESLTEYSIRIDYVQHNVSALLGLYNILGAQNVRNR